MATASRVPGVGEGSQRGQGWGSHAPEWDLRPPTIAEFFAAFAPRLPWTDLPTWPPDVFALCNLVLDHTEAYRFAVSPLPGRRWPPRPDWNDRVRQAGRAWREAAAVNREPPPAVREEGEIVTRHRDVPLAAVRSGECPEVVQSLLTLHAMADEACSGLAAAGAASPDDRFEQRAWHLLESQGSLATIDPTRVRVTPKAQFASRGITIRSLSRYLALSHESIDVRWRRIQTGRGGGFDGSEYNIVLVPWPLHVRADDFRPVEGPLENMDRAAFGFFEFSPTAALDLDLLREVLRAARRKVRRVDAVVLPEASVEPGDIPAIETILVELGVAFLIAGVRETAGAHGLGRNYAHLAMLGASGGQRYQQSKHHRWCLDESQIHQFHLTRALDPSKLWWEAIELPARDLQIIDVGNGGLMAPLVCEDLARMDEVADLLRRIGPGLVVALLLDGPQLPQRWPCRYATVFADEPGSAVLTLTSFGMAARSTPPGMPPSRSVAMWSDPTSGLHQLELARGANGLLVTASVHSGTQWTADGRCHEHNAPSVVLTRVEQLAARSNSDRSVEAQVRSDIVMAGSG
jgi:hypothetical protein